MLKELEEVKGEILDQSFFEKKRNNQANTAGCLKNQMLEQQKFNHRAALAKKYGQIWLNKVREKRKMRESASVFD